MTNYQLGCRELGLLIAYEYKKGLYLFDEPDPRIVDQIPQLRKNARLIVSHTTQEVQYAT